jgi:hypothetical protein
MEIQDLKIRLTQLTQENIDFEMDSWSEPLEGCSVGDWAISNKDLEPDTNVEESLVGALKLKEWMEDTYDDTKELMKKVLYVLDTLNKS